MLLTQSLRCKITAIVCKVVGAFVPTYLLTQMNFKESLSVGFLMSTKGLVELIVLNLGFSLGVLTQIEFTIMVMMALVTTFITSPVVAFIYPKKMMLLRERANFQKGSEFSVLLCVSNRMEALRLLSMTKNWVALNKKVMSRVVLFGTKLTATSRIMCKPFGCCP